MRPPAAWPRCPPRPGALWPGARGLVALWLGALLCACGQGGSDSGRPIRPHRVGTQLAVRQELTRAMDSSPRSIDPSLSTDLPGGRIMDDLFEGLTTLSVDGRVVPAVADHWEIGAGGRSYTFHLRATARWSNGEPVRAGDFVYAWRRLADPRTASDYAQALAPVRNAVAVSEGRQPPEQLGVAAPDDRTLVVTLEAPTPYFPELLTKAFSFPLYEPAIRAHGEDWTRPGYLVSNGPFLLREYVVGGHIVLERNARYRDAAQVRLQRVTYYPVDRTVQTDRYMAGDIDFTESFSVQQLGWLRSQLGTQVVSAPYLGVFGLAFNMRRAPFAGNLPLRQALSMAVDRDILVGKIRQYLYPAAWSLTPPLPGFTPPAPAWQSLDREARHAEARRLYALAGYTRDRPLRVELSYPTDSDNQHIFAAVAAMWRETLGAEVALRNQEFKVLLNNRRMHRLPLFMYAWIGDFSDPTTFQQLFQTGFGINDGEYSNPEYDALLNEAAADADAARRLQRLEQAERLLNRDVPFIPLYYYASRHLIKPWVGGWASNLSDRNLSRYMHILEHD